MPARPFSARNPGIEPDLVPSVGTAPRRRGLEAAALVLFAVSLFLALALASVRIDPRDPDLLGANWTGPVGAAAAGWAVRGFGLVAWLGPLELFFLGLPLLRGRRHEALGLRIAGDLIVAVVAAALVQVLAPELLVFGRTPAGGNVGLFFGELMRGMFSTLGSLLVGITTVGLILIGRSSFSFIRACQAAARLSQGGVVGFGAVARRLGAAWLEASRLRSERRRAATEAAAPHIDEHQSDEAIIAEIAEDDSDWPGLEKTGPPPLAISEALRAGFSGLAAAESISTPSAARAAPRAVETAGPAARAEPKGPRIVDTIADRAVKRAAPSERVREIAGFKLPPTDLLQAAVPVVTDVDRERILERATQLEKTLADYGVSARVEEIHPGPTVTTYEVAPQPGTKVSKVANLTDDLALGLSRKVRIVAPIPGKSRIGFELPNDERIEVNLRELVEDKRFEKLAERVPLPVVLGRDIVGAPFYADLAAMPHVIVAGATGAGKSVGLNVMLSSLLFRRTPEQLRLLMIDPKVVELAPFDGIPHMLLPVVTDMKQAATALRWAVNEMERRYQLFANAGTKNIATYNRWVKKIADGELPAPTPEQVQALSPDGSVVSVPAAKHGADGVVLPGSLPHIVIVVDEFADLMMQQGKDVEASVARLAQKARAAGMHVVLATQRPSVDVITGMIKANFPSRIAFRVAQRVDGRTILDEQGAELLLGRGDMLVKLNGSSEMRRVQCPFISEEEVSALCDYLRAQAAPEYHEAILLEADDEEGAAEDNELCDARFDEAVRIVAETQRCSTSWLQRKMTVGYNRAAKIVETMEKRGLVGPPNGARDREVLIRPEQAP
jgi:S-DNA-T family DNA segregation ATPase FtsK/SpoIIIE